jgi:NAD+ kinase
MALEQNQHPLPVDLVLVRHGQSVGNVAIARARDGDDTAYTAAFRQAHSSTWQLTDLGREQAMSAGRFLRKHDLAHFDRYTVSPYDRALETAALLGLPNADWFTENYLREREWGHLDTLPDSEKWIRFAEAMERQDAEGFYWTPPNGESYAQASLRIDSVIAAHSREHGNGRAVIVCHEDVMRIFRVRIEHISQHDFKEAMDSEPIHNGQILHYTRRDAEGTIHPFMVRRRSICPWDESLTDSSWKTIVRKSFSNEELLAILRNKNRHTA